MILGKARLSNTSLVELEANGGKERPAGGRSCSSTLPPLSRRLAGSRLRMLGLNRLGEGVGRVH